MYIEYCLHCGFIRSCKGGIRVINIGSTMSTNAHILCLLFYFEPTLVLSSALFFNVWVLPTVTITHPTNTTGNRVNLKPSAMFPLFHILVLEILRYCISSMPTTFIDS